MCHVALDYCEVHEGTSPKRVASLYVSSLKSSGLWGSRSASYKAEFLVALESARADTIRVAAFSVQ